MSRSQPSQIPFMETQTHKDLCDALTEERSARTACLVAAEEIRRAGLHAVAHVFDFSAAQMKEHAEIFSGLIGVYGGDPPPFAMETPTAEEAGAALRQGAKRAEEAAQRYSAMSENAHAEGYPRVAAALLHISGTRRQHAGRFLRYAGALEDGTLFSDADRVGWVCLDCGCLCYGLSAPQSCEGCSGRGSYIRSSFQPFVQSRQPAFQESPMIPSGRMTSCKAL